VAALQKCLLPLLKNEINLSKLQSFPIPGSHFKYSFHADMEFENIHQFNTVIEKLKPLTEHLKIYGIYKNGKLK